MIMQLHWLSLLSLLSSIPLAFLAAPPSPLWSDIRVKHTWNSVPVNWECLGPPPTNTIIDLYIALKASRENALVEALYGVSSPGHQKYGAHLSKEEVAELVAPHQDTLELAHSWLEHHGVPSSSISPSHGGGWLTIKGVPVSQAEDLLGASYQLYKYTGKNESEAILRTVSYALPEALHAHVETVAPTTHFASMRRPLKPPRKRSSEEAAATANVTSGEPMRVLLRREYDGEVKPSFLRSLYKTEAYVPAAVHVNKLGVLGLNNEVPSEKDLKAFMEDFRKDAVDAIYSVTEVNGGGYDELPPGHEANLDIQYATAIAYPTPQIFYSTGGRLRTTDGRLPDAGDSYLEWLRYLLDLPSIPPTISISYGDIEPHFPPEYVEHLCVLFAVLGARGVSILAGSGNFGVGPGKCHDDFGNTWFMPTFPASCPFVTSVGGTKSHDPEVALPISGGGFSLWFSRPKYQESAVTRFLDFNGDEHADLFNPKGRGIPDIAAQGNQYLYTLGLEVYEVSGTSASTATVAGIISLLNDYRIATGRTPLGFLNPWLYSRSGLPGLTDIKSGSNPGCDTTGFTAISGWDPVTGLGTLNFDELQRSMNLNNL